MPRNSPRGKTCGCRRRKTGRDDRVSVHITDQTTLLLACSLLDTKSSWICIAAIFATASFVEGEELRERLLEPRRALARFLLAFFGDFLGERERLRE